MTPPFEMGVSAAGMTYADSFGGVRNGGGQFDAQATDLRPLAQTDLLRTTVRTQFPQVGRAIERQGAEALYPLLVPWQQWLPKDFRGSMRGGEITASIIDELPIRGNMGDALILASAFSDVGRLRRNGDHAAISEIYSTDRPWRMNPDAPEWAIVHGHPDESKAMLTEALGDSQSDIATIVWLHHSLKKNTPYSDEAVSVYKALPRRLRHGVEIVVGVDVAEALVSKQRGRGRSYVDEREIQGDLPGVVLNEVAIDPRIAKLAVRHALAYEETTSGSLCKVS